MRPSRSTSALAIVARTATVACGEAWAEASGVTRIVAGT